MNEPEWVLRETVLALQEQSLFYFGGLSGIRDEGMLDSALARPLQLFHYSGPNLFDLAASYAFGLVKNHPFFDGNKRAAFTVAIVFIELNGYQFEAAEPEAAVNTLALAASEMTEKAFAAWLEANSRKQT